MKTTIWLARDKDGALYAFKKYKPRKGTSNIAWIFDGDETDYIMLQKDDGTITDEGDILLFIFPDLETLCNWEDDEPLAVNLDYGCLPEQYEEIDNVPKDIEQSKPCAKANNSSSYYFE